ncbi:MAG: carotenoid 1,2-hydratase [Comamonadaceae bacterium]|nr:MAG: carotenoid 1,2-hydratase [Comamonadaceae bacterium]
MRRRELVLTALANAGLTLASPAHALPAANLRFPRDHGSHPDYRTEWWYITGHAKSGNREFGFQVTFFRTRIVATQGMTSAFAAKQMIFAHAAVTDVRGRKLWHDQRIARAGFDVAQAGEQDTAIRLRDWSLVRKGDGYTAVVAAGDFSIELAFTPTQPVLLQGDRGLSRKGPDASQASYYYSQPQLAAAGRLRVKGETFDISGKAWLDHEWSQEVLHPSAVGWDWIGMNLDDGSALTAFRLRDGKGGTLWDGGSFRHPKSGAYVFSRGEVIFQPVRSWKSPMSNAAYPVEWVVRTPADFYTVRALVDDQELDSRNSTGAIYWEGLSELIDSNGRPVGRGYLEMTGYARPLRL